MTKAEAYEFVKTLTYEENIILNKILLAKKQTKHIKFEKGEQ